MGKLTRRLLSVLLVTTMVCTGNISTAFADTKDEVSKTRVITEVDETASVDEAEVIDGIDTLEAAEAEEIAEIDETVETVKEDDKSADIEADEKKVTSLSKDDLIFAGDADVIERVEQDNEESLKKADGRRGGAIETPTDSYYGDYYPNEGESLEGVESFPSRFNPLDASTEEECMRTLPPTRDQSRWGTCWAFSSIFLAEMETQTTEDLSEHHLAYFTYHSPKTDPLGNLDGDNRIGAQYTNSYLFEGGNNIFAANVLAAWEGAASESIAPYPKYDRDTCYTVEVDRLSEDIAFNDMYHLQNYYTVDPTKNREGVKDLIMKYGAVGTLYNDDGNWKVDPDWFSFGGGENACYYCPIDYGTNHVIAIVGWDDDFAKENFNTSIDDDYFKNNFNGLSKIPEGDGAWLIRNSWSTTTEYSHDSYFWLSYYDKTLYGLGMAFDFDDADNYDNNYQYDGGMVNGFTDIHRGANVYTAEKAETIEAVGFGLGVDSAGYKVSVYTDMTEANNPESGILRTVKEGVTTYPGFYTVDLDSSIKISKGETFAIVVELENKGEWSGLVCEINNTYNNNWYWSKTEIEKGQSFAYFNEWWVDLVDLEFEENFRIKAYTDIDEEAYDAGADYYTLTSTGVSPAYYKTTDSDEWDAYPLKSDSVEVKAGKTVELAYLYHEYDSFPQFVGMRYVSNDDDKYDTFPDTDVVTINGNPYTVFQYEVKGDTEFSASTRPPVDAVNPGNIEDRTIQPGDEEIYVVSIEGADLWRGRYYAKRADRPEVTIKLTEKYSDSGVMPCIKIKNYDSRGSRTNPPEFLKIPAATVENEKKVYTYTFNYDSANYKVDWLLHSEGIIIEEAECYYVTLDGNGGALSDERDNLQYYTNKYYRGYDYKLTNEFLRKGYSFTGWNTRADGSGTSYRDGYTIKNFAAAGETKTLYAQWKPATYTIRYNSNYPSGKNVIATQKISYGNVPFELSSVASLKFAENGAIFKEWSTSKNPTGDEAEKTYNDKAVIDEDFAEADGAIIDLYAQWKTLDYLIFFDAGEGDVLDGTMSMGGNQLLDIVADDVNHIGVAGLDINVGNLTQSHGLLQAMKYGEEVALSGNEFVRYGYTLSGWKNSKTGKVIKPMVVSMLTTETECVVLTAQWTKNTYNIKYNLNGGSFVSGYKPVVKMTVDDMADAANIKFPGSSNVAKKGYKFAGWYQNPECTQGNVSGVIASDASKLKSYNLYAKWEPIVYDVVLKGNGYGATSTDDNWNEENVSTVITVSYDEDYTLPVVTRGGYTFKGWASNADGSGKKITAKTIKNLSIVDKEELVFYAQWSINTNKITYDLQGGKLPSGAPNSYKISTEPLELKIPVKEGYVFKGYISEVKPGGNAVVNPIVTDTVVSADGDIDPITERVTGVSILDGSYGDVVLTAAWEEIKYKVTYKDELGGELMTKVYSYSDAVDLVDIAKQIEAGDDTKFADKSIVGFYAMDGSRKVDYSPDKAYSKISKEHAANIILTAVTGPKTYYITYAGIVANDGWVMKNPIRKYTVNASKDINLPKPAKTGYIFQGWDIYDKDDHKIVSNSFVIPKGTSGNITVVRKSTPVSSKIILDKNSRDAVLIDGYIEYTDGSTSQTYDSENKKYPVIFTRPGYDFAGYNTKANGKGYSLAIQPDGTYMLPGKNVDTKGKDVKIYAIWQPKQYNIVYAGLVAGDVNNNPTESDFEKKITLKNPVRAGYTFVGWKAEKVNVADAETISVTTNKNNYVTALNKYNTVDIKLTAEFTENSYKVKLNSNGGVSYATGKSVNADLGSVKYTDDVNAKIKEYIPGVAYANGFLKKKGYVFKGFATDKKGVNIVCTDASIENEYYGEVTGLSTKNNATVTLYAIWEKIAFAKPVVKVEEVSVGELSITYSSTTPMTIPNYEVQISDTINFRNIINVDRYTGADGFVLGSLPRGRYYIRVRQFDIDDINADIHPCGAWSDVVSYYIAD